MTASVNSPEDVLNLSLRRIGYKLRLGSIWEGSEASRACLDLYSQTRDEALRESDWGFAERTAALTLLKTAPYPGYIPPRVWAPATDPPPPWVYEYAYPGDCLKVRSIKSTPIIMPVFFPQPRVFDIANDNAYTPPQKVILCNVVGALCVYTGRITDPRTWEASFTEGLAASLARRLAAVLTTLDVEKIEGADEQAETAMAEMKQG